MKKSLSILPIFLFLFTGAIISGDFTKNSSDQPETAKLLSTNYADHVSWRLRLMTSNLMSSSPSLVDQKQKNQILKSLILKEKIINEQENLAEISKPEKIYLSCKGSSIGIWLKNEEPTIVVESSKKSSLPIAARPRAISLSIDPEISFLTSDNQFEKIVPSPSDNSTPLLSHKSAFYKLATSQNPDEKAIEDQLNDSSNLELLNTTDLLHRCFCSGYLSPKLFRLIKNRRPSLED